jgi:hypothetical protein
MFRTELSPPLERALDLAIASASIALLPLNLGAWATLAWIRWIDAAAGGRKGGS